jgi:extradiol dioxygenase family protein
MDGIKKLFGKQNTNNSADEVKRMYREVFGTRVGREVLAHMLVELGFFNEIVTDEQKILCNYARRLLKLMGVLQPKNINDITDALMNVSFEEEETK